MPLTQCPNCGGNVSDRAKTCPHCHMSIVPASPSSATDDTPQPISTTSAPTPIQSILRQCPNCGKSISPRARKCPQCGATFDTNPDTTSNNDKSPIPQPKPIPKALIFGAAGVFVVLVIIGALIYYNNVYLPRKIDAEAPRYYTVATSLRMRSSPDFSLEFNKLESLPYGTELITYLDKSEPQNYYYCKVEKRDATGKVIKDKTMIGYVSSAYVMDKTDFFRLNSIFGNDDAKKMLSETRYRKALLDYFKQHEFVGKITMQDVSQYGLDSNWSRLPQWQVFCKDTKAKSNNVYRAKKYRLDSKYSDLAVIIQNIATGERRLLYYIFDDETEFPTLLCEQYVSEAGYMKNGTLKLYNTDGNYYVSVSYTD